MTAADFWQLFPSPRDEDSHADR